MVCDFAFIVFPNSVCLCCWFLFCLWLWVGAVLVQVGLVFGLVLLCGVCCGLGLVVGFAKVFTTLHLDYVESVGCGCGGCWVVFCFVGLFDKA